MRKYKVEFLSPGTFVSESSSQDICSCDTAKAVEMSKSITERHGAKPFGFRFQTLLVHDDVPDGEGGLLKVESKVVNTSGIHFLGGIVESYDEVVARNDEKEEILRSNMQGNGYWFICTNTNSFKSTLPFAENDVIVNGEGVITERGNSPARMEYRAVKDAERDEYYRSKGWK